jgi:hypothetical protein
LRITSFSYYILTELIMVKEKTVTFAVIMAFFLVARMATGKIIFVDGDAAGENNGSSWENAHNNLWDAIAVATMGDQIRVAQGTYTPLRRFVLKDGVAIVGGYAGFGAQDPNSRDIEAFKTILSGKLDDMLWSDNVIWIEKADSSTILDGFTIMEGHSTGIVRNGRDCCGGGGIYNKGGSPTILNCIITANEGSLRGGGMANVDGGSPTLVNCTFECNYSFGHGGGIYNRDSNLNLVDCRFINNFSDGFGGGIYNEDGAINLSNCIFINNSAHVDGGGIYNGYSAPLVLRRCSFIGNLAGNHGGGVVSEEMLASIENCIFSGDIAKELGGGIIGGVLTNCTLTGNKAPCNSAAASAFLINCIVWGNLEGDSGECPWSVGALYCCLESSVAYADGVGGVFVDPCFVQPGYWDPKGTPDDLNDDFWVDGDYHLKSQAGRWDPKTQAWIVDDVTSPCIDAGDPGSPIGHEPFPNGGRVNIGAYGGTAEASKSYFGKQPCETIIAGDINGDCVVNFTDFKLMAYHWLENNAPNP